MKLSFGALAVALVLPIAAMAQSSHANPAAGLGSANAQNAGGNGNSANAGGNSSTAIRVVPALFMPDVGGLDVHPKIEADAKALIDDFKQLAADVKAKNATAVSADQTKITADMAKLQADVVALRAAMAKSAKVLDAQTVVDKDRMDVDRARVELVSDEFVGNSTEIKTSQAALVAAETKLRADLATLASLIAALPI